MRARLPTVLLLGSTPIMADTLQTYIGKVPPFEIITAISNYAIIKGETLSTQISIPVKSGTKSNDLS